MGTILKQGISGVSYVSGFVDTCVGNRHKYVKGVGVGVLVSVGSNEKGSPAHLRFATGCPLGWLAAGKRAMCDVGDW